MMANMPAARLYCAARHSFVCVNCAWHQALFDVPRSFFALRLPTGFVVGH
jgi:hypothetical protein